MYTKFSEATEDLLAWIGMEGLEMELYSHSISHRSSNEKNRQTNAIKVVSADNDGQAILDGVMQALAKTPKEHQASSTVDL